MTTTPNDWCPFAEQYPVRKYWRGNRGRDAVVMHIAQGSYQGTIGWFQGNSPATAHFIIAKDGRIAQFVSVNDSAWGNGITPTNDPAIWIDPAQNRIHPPWTGLRAGLNPNWYTISVEHEGMYTEPWTPAMFAANTRLLQWLGTQFPSLLPYAPNRTLIGHMDISPIDRKNCPGPHADWNAIAAAANGVIDHGVLYVVGSGGATIRTGPTRAAGVVRQARPGETLLVVQENVIGQMVGGTNRWHRIDGSTYVHSGAVQRA